MKKFVTILFILFNNFICLASHSAQKINFGVSYFYPPFVFSNSAGQVYGFDIEIAKALCHEMQAVCTFKPIYLNRLFESLDNHSVDAIMGALSITPERKFKYNFTAPYYKSTMSYVALAASNLTDKDLLQHKIGVVARSTFFNYLVRKYDNQAKVIPFDTNEETMNALANHQIDFVLIDSPTANYWVGYSTGLFKIVGNPQILPFDEGYGIAVRKGEKEYIEPLNKALNTIKKNGVYDKIVKAYFPATAQPSR